MKILRKLVVFLIPWSAVVAAEKPNIMVFLVDDMGLMDTSVPFLTDGRGRPETHALNRFYHTPNMERLALSGIRFERFYANSVCSPSRISLMTGQSSARHHTTQWISPTRNNAGKFGPPDWKWKGITEGQENLPSLLRKAGYRTIHAGKAHFGPNGSFGEQPRNFGFDVNIAGRAIGRPDSYYGTDDFGAGKKGGHAVRGLGKYHGRDIYLTEALTLEMKREIGVSAAMGKPFFAYMSYYAVHAPFMPNKRYAARYADSKMPKDVKAFATMIETMDNSVGDLLDHLESLGVARDTLVMFLGDNGTDARIGGLHDISGAAPLRGIKGTHYEGGMRVPFIASWARPDASHPVQEKLPIAAGTLTREMGVITDIFPTVLRLAGQTWDGPVDGRDLAPVLAGGRFDGERTFLMHFPHEHRSGYFTVLRKGEWKLIYHYRRPADQCCELFHLVNDRSESSNLAAAEPEKCDEMIRAMAAALEDAGAQFVRAGGGTDEVLRPVVP